ncbi:MAG: hypothetical protein K2X48_03760 [Chitinophagaceae bacterium]|nr:hypothetical protein [Chitinophagaceae bacterium]
MQFGKDGVNHTKGNATVVKKVKEKFDDLFCVAIIDKDRRDIDFIKDACEYIDCGGFDSYFKLFKRNGKPHYFIQIVPVIEEWIVKVSAELEIDLDETELGVSTIDDLMKLSKTTSSKNDVRFVSLFKRLVKVSEEKQYLPVIKLKKIILFLLDKNYQGDVNELKNV